MAATEIIPNPDPSVVTSQAIDRAVGASRDIISARISGIEKGIEVFQADLTRVPTSVDRAVLGLRELIETRLDGVDHDMIGMHSNLDKREKDIAAAVQHLRDLVFSKIEELSAVTTEKFKGVGSQFAERDTRTDQRAGDTKLAVDAAFAAADKGLTKIEIGFTKQIDGINGIVDTKTGNLASGLSDLKDRITVIESRTQGIGAANAEARNDQNDSRGNLALVVAAAAVLVSILIHFIK